MRFETSQSMKLGQQMKLAPRMIQSMEILQMSLTELEERIEQELASNPTLELVENERERRDGEQEDAGLERALGECQVGQGASVAIEEFCVGCKTILSTGATRERGRSVPVRAAVLASFSSKLTFIMPL